MLKLLPILILALATACSPKVRTQLTDHKPQTATNTVSKVTVINIDQNVPPSAQKLGTVKVTDGGMTLKCDWQTVLEKAEMEAIKIGGNLLKITKHRVPGIMSSCHQIEADIYFVDGNSGNLELQTAKIVSDSLPNLAENTIKPQTPQPFQKYRISANGGLSYLVAKTNKSVPVELKNYISELKSGSHFSIDGGYFWKENIGLGLKYSSFYSKNSINNVTVTDMNGQTGTGKLADDINTQFIGVILYNRGYSKNRNTVWFLNGSLGYLAYKDRATVIDDFLITGSTLGGVLDFGVDFKLAENFYFGLGAGYTVGVLKQIKYSKGFSTQTKKLDKDNYESMNRLDLSTGLRWAW